MYFYRWLRGPVYLLEGLIITLSLGFITPTWTLWVEGKYLDSMEEP